MTLTREDTSGQLSSGIAQQLLERQQSYLSRKVKQPLIRLWDKNMKFIARIEDQERWDYEEIATEDGTAHVEIVGKNSAWLREIIVFQTRTEEDLHITIDPDPDNPTDYKNRWGGKVLTIEDKEVAGEPTRTTLNCISNRRHFRGVLIGANPIFPVEVQIPKLFLWGGPTAFTCASTMWINLFRLQTLNGFYLLPRNLFAPETWLENVNVLNWPIQVMPMKPLQDQTRWCTIGARWKDAPTIMNPVMKDAGVICRALTWLPGDPPPYSEVFGPVLGEIIKPKRACVILDFQDKSGVDGPTGTLIDGAINLIASTADDLITSTLRPIDANGDGETDPFFRRILGVAPKPSPFVYRDANYGGVKEKTLVIHKSQATDIVTGGKSPGWVNQAITFAIRYGISQLANAISTLPGAPAQAPGSEGLDNLYQGQLDDCVSRDTLVDSAFGPCRIDELAESGEPFSVWSLTPDGTRVLATATMAFKKGRAELFEYRLSDGRSIKATKAHRFLTEKGFVRGGDLCVGMPVATVDHAKLLAGLDVPPRAVRDSDYEHVPETAAVTFRDVASIRSLGVDDFYDLHVPGWENYSANGFWNHNTFLAFMRYVNPIRSSQAGAYAFREYFETGSGSAYTINSIQTLAEGDYKMRAYSSMKFDVGDGLPFILGQDYGLGDRVSAEIRGVVYTDQVLAIKAEGSRETSGRPIISFGDDSREEDPVARGFRTIANVASAAALLAGSGDLF